jgi:hypothetical protein
MNRKMTRFARAGKCDGFGASGLATDDPTGLACASNDAKPINPNPQADRRNRKRRDGLNEVVSSFMVVISV